MQEWDRIAEDRNGQVTSGKDLSFEHILVPTMFQLLEGADMALVLDIGSGTGHFTRRLSQVAGRVIAVEPSTASVKIARANCLRARNVDFIAAPLQSASAELQKERVTAAVASMTLMTVPELGGFAKALGAVLQKDAKFAATFTHPWFWPEYCGYRTKPWFHYEKEIFIEAPFVISKSHLEMRTTHIHRPLEQYVAVFANAGFRLESVVEPMPSPELLALYPRPWRFPRFIGMRWTKSF